MPTCPAPGCGAVMFWKLCETEGSKLYGKTFASCPDWQAHSDVKTPLILESVWRKRCEIEKRKQALPPAEAAPPKKAKPEQSAHSQASGSSPSDKAFVEEVQQLKKMMLELLDSNRQILTLGDALLLELTSATKSLKREE